MPRLRKEIKPPNTLNIIPGLQLRIPLHHNRHIPRLRMHITTNVDDAPRPKRQQLPQEVLAAPFARGIDDEQRLLGRIRHVLEEGGGVVGGEAGVGEVIGAGVVAGGGDGVGVDVDAEAGFEEWREGDGEEAGAGVGVEEVFDGVWVLVVVGREGLLADVVGEAGEDGIVVLEESAGFVGEGVVVDVFDGDGVVVCYAAFFFDVVVSCGAEDVAGFMDAALCVGRGLDEVLCLVVCVGLVLGRASRGLAHEKGSPPGVLPDILRHALPFSSETSSNDVRSQRTILNVHIHASVLECIPDGWDLHGLVFGHLLLLPSSTTAGSREMRRELRAIPILHGRRECVANGWNQLRNKPGKVGICLFHNAFLMGQLVLVGQHLQLTPRTLAKVLTSNRRIIPQRPGLKHLDKIRHAVE